MASYAVNDRAVAHARKLIGARRYVLDSDWGEVQPSADDENAADFRSQGSEFAAHELLQLLDKKTA